MPTHPIAAVLTTLTAVLPLAGQMETSTLDALTDRSDVIAVLRVVADRGHQAARHEVLFRTVRVLHGNLDGRVTLSEPPGRGCARGLAAVVPGGAHLAFLRRERGALVLAASTTRALPRLDPYLLQHVEALLRTTDVDGRRRLLGEALAAPSPRIRQDAALALGLLAGLERAGAEERARYAAALPRAVRDGDAALPGLLRVATRLRLQASIDALLPAYLDGELAGAERMVREALPRIDAAGVASRLAQAPPTVGQRSRRAVALLATLPAEAARPALLAIARGADAAAAVGAGTELLRAGLAADRLAELTSPALRQQAESRLRAERPRFRAISEALRR